MTGLNGKRGCCALLLILLVATTLPARFARAVPVPEKLVYSLSWMGIAVGTATQEISEDGAHRKILSHALSNDWLSAFYPVDDRTESLLAKNGSHFPGESRYYRMTFKEGRRTRDREITFDQEKRVGRFHDRLGGEQVEIPIVENTYDIYASFYYVRSQPLEPGSSFMIHVLDGKELRNIEVKVLKRERVTVPAGEFNTILVRPMVKSEGVFEGKGGALIWLTDDSRRIPVKAETKVRVGSVTAVLTGGTY